MNEKTERIDRYLRSINLPTHASDSHRHALRRQILGEIERKRTMSLQNRNWRLVALVTLACTGVVAATVAGVRIYKYRYVDTDAAGHYRLISDDEQSALTLDGAVADSPQQAVEYAEAMSAQSQRGDRKLVRVIKIEVNGQLERKLFVYEYTLPDGRTTQVGEAAPEGAGQWTLTDEQHEEMAHLKKAGPGKPLDSYEEQVQGSAFAFRRQQYLLGDGTEIVWSIGELKSN